MSPSPEDPDTETAISSSQLGLFGSTEGHGLLVTVTERTMSATGETQGLAEKTQGLAGKTQGLAGLPARVRARVEALSRRPRAEELRNVIRDLCAYQAFTPGELAALLDRKDVGHFVNAHLSPMVREGALERIYPENPAHPRQAYRTVMEKPTESE